MTVTVFDIKRFAVHDGPGIRTSLFLKGCPLNCKWCHNPEGISPARQLWYFENQCLKCGDCVAACPEGALTLKDRIIIDRNLCTSCGICTKTCPTGALHFIGEELTIDQAEEELLKDRAFYEESGGGITLTGGEPLMQMEGAREILRRMKNRGVHTAVETSLFISSKALEELFPLVDYFLADLKLIDSKEHKDHTGVENRQILENLRLLVREGKPAVIRVPLIPGFTDHRENLEGIAEFLAGLEGDLPVELMNFNPLARDKFRILGRPYEPAGADKPFSDEEMDRFREIFSARGLRVS